MHWSARAQFSEDLVTLCLGAVLTASREVTVVCLSHLSKVSCNLWWVNGSSEGLASRNNWGLHLTMDQNDHTWLFPWGKQNCACKFWNSSTDIKSSRDGISFSYLFSSRSWRALGGSGIKSLIAQALSLITRPLLVTDLLISRRTCVWEVRPVWECCPACLPNCFKARSPGHHLLGKNPVRHLGLKKKKKRISEAHFRITMFSISLSRKMIQACIFGLLISESFAPISLCILSAGLL